MKYSLTNDCAVKEENWAQKVFCLVLNLESWSRIDSFYDEVEYCSMQHSSESCIIVINKYVTVQVDML